MSKQETEEPITSLINDLSSKEVDVRKKASLLLGDKKIKQAIPSLINALKNDPDKVVRNNAARSLGKIGQDSNEVISVLCDALNDPDYYVKQSAAWSLGKLKNINALEPLINLIRGGAAKVYVSSGADSNVSKEELTDTLKTDGMKYLDIQIKAIQAIGEIGREEAIEPLIGELSDDEAQIRCAIVLALGKIKSKKAVPKLIEVLNDPLWYVRRDAAIALGMIGDPRSIEALIDKISDKYQDVADNVAKALGKIGKIAVALTFLLKPKEEIVKKMVKENFKSKQELVDAIKKAIDSEKDESKKEKFKEIVAKLAL